MLNFLTFMNLEWVHCIRSKLCLNRDSIFLFILIVCVKGQTDVHAHERLEEVTRSPPLTLSILSL